MTSTPLNYGLPWPLSTLIKSVFGTYPPPNEMLRSNSSLSSVSPSSLFTRQPLNSSNSALSDLLDDLLRLLLVLVLVPNGLSLSLLLPLLLLLPLSLFFLRFFFSFLTLSRFCASPSTSSQTYLIYSFYVNSTKSLYPSINLLELKLYSEEALLSFIQLSVSEASELERSDCGFLLQLSSISPAFISSSLSTSCPGYLQRTVPDYATCFLIKPSI